MMRTVLIDSCIWIDFFNRNRHRGFLEEISDKYSLSTNYCILAEVIPGLIHQKEQKAAQLLLAQRKLDLNIDWPGIIELQTGFLKKGINKIGTVDLLIIQNVIQNNAAIASKDKHIKLMCKTLKIQMIEP